MLRRCLPFAPTVAAAAHAPLPFTPVLTSSVSQRVGAVATTCWEGQRSFGIGIWREAHYAADTERAIKRELLEEDLQASLKVIEDLTNNPLFSSLNPHDTRISMLLDNAVSRLLVVAKDPLVTQADLGEMRKAGVLGVLCTNYFSSRDRPPHLLSNAQELAKILSTPPKPSDPHHYLNQPAASVKKGGEDPAKVVTPRLPILFWP